MASNSDNLRETAGPLPSETAVPQAQLTNLPVAPLAVPKGLANNSQHEILRELGRGGMGVVYLAKNKLMDRLEVLKVINQTMIDVPGSLERFLREIRSAAKLNHENVVKAHSAMQIGELLVFAMEYVDGEDLAKIVKTHGPLPVANACHYTRQAALGLQHAHDKQMVHRDIKPQNLILACEGKKHTLKILDFGLAKATSEKAVQTQLTGEGKMLGTPEYMAPEQMRDAASADIRADIYSLGCTLYFLLAGTTCFKAKSLMALVLAHQSQVPRPLNEVRPDVPAELAAVVAKMMAKAPAQRFQKPSEIAQALLPFVKVEVKAKFIAAAPREASVESLTNTPGEANTAPQALPENRVQKPGTTTVSQDVPGPPRAKRNQRGGIRTAPAPKNGLPWLWISAGLGGGLFALTVLAVVLWSAGVFTNHQPDEQRPPAPLARDAGPKQDSLADPPFGKKQESQAIFTPLFNGKDLTGWKEMHKNPFHWTVVDEAIVATRAPTFLLSERGNYQNIHLRIEAKISNGWSGLLEFPSPPPDIPRPSKKIFTVQFGTSGKLTGALDYSIAEPIEGKFLKSIPVKEPLHQPDQWFSLELIVEGDRIQTFVNGTKAVDWINPGQTWSEGHLLFVAGLRASTPRGMWLRRIEIKELPTAPLKGKGTK